MKIKKGDNIQVLSGKDRGKNGKVERVLIKQGAVVVPGINQYKKAVKKQADRPGELVTLNRPLNISKVGLICTKCKKVTRVGLLNEKGIKYRVCKKCGEKI